LGADFSRRILIAHFTFVDDIFFIQFSVLGSFLACGLGTLHADSNQVPGLFFAGVSLAEGHPFTIRGKKE
jgi:hypothetical protein